jgi:hypothetical protein
VGEGETVEVSKSESISSSTSELTPSLLWAVFYPNCLLEPVNGRI